MKKFLLASAAAAVMVTGASTSASAFHSCTVHGTVIRVVAYPDDSPDSAVEHTIYMRSGGLADHYFFANTNDDDMAALAVSAKTSQTLVTLWGINSCVVTGPGAYNAGDIQRLYIGGL